MPVSWIDGFWDIIFPPSCLLCQLRLSADEKQQSTPFCERCASRVSPVGWFCLRCKSAGEKGLPCSCYVSRHGLQRLFSLAWYEGEWRKLLHRFKYYSQPQLATPLGRHLAAKLQQDSRWPSADFVSSIPLHPQRYKERGYNQSYLLARRVSSEMKISYAPLLQRVRSTVSQTSLSRRERFANMHGAFAISAKYEKFNFKGSSILLIDDIYTTGSTLQEAARVLVGAGAREVNGAVMGLQRMR